MSLFYRLLIAALAAAALAIGISIYNPSDPVLERTDRFERHFHWSTGFPFLSSYLLFTPKQCGAGRNCPLLVALHGGYKRSLGAYYAASDRFQQRRPSFVLMPLAPFSRPWAVPPGAEGELGTSEALPLALEIIESVVVDLPIDRERIYVTGSSVGGVGTFAAMAHHADVFAAGVAVNGAWPVHAAQELRDAHLAIYQGTSDPMFPHTQKLIGIIQAHGGRPKFVSMPGIGHDSRPAYRDDGLWDWLFAQRRVVK